MPKPKLNPILLESMQGFESNPDSCLVRINAWVNESNQSVEALCARGALLSRLERYHEALDDHLKAAAQEPDNPVLQYNLACAYNRLQTNTQAMEHIEFAISKRSDPQFLLMRGVINLDMAKLEEAIVDFSKLIEVNQLLDRAYFYRGIAEVRQGHFRSGLSDLNKTNYEFFVGELLLWKGVCLSALGEHKSARDTLFQSLESYSNDSDVYLELAKNEYHLGNYKLTLLFCNAVTNTDEASRAGIAKIKSLCEKKIKDS